VRPHDRKIRTRERNGKERTLLKRIFRVCVGFILISLFLALVWYGTRLPPVTITDVTIIGGETVPPLEIRTLVLRELEGTYMLLIPKRFSYMYPHDRLVEVIENISRIHSVSVERESATELRVSFKEYVPYALWCIYNAPNMPCFFMDKEGYAFETAPPLTGGTLIRHTTEGSQQIERGTVIDSAMLNRIDRFLERMEDEVYLRVSTVVYKSNGDIEFLVNGGGTILISGSRDFDETFANLITLLSADEFSHIAPGNFRYIDIRFGNKLFVNETLEEVETRIEAQDVGEGGIE